MDLGTPEPAGPALIPTGGGRVFAAASLGSAGLIALGLAAPWVEEVEVIEPLALGPFAFDRVLPGAMAIIGALVIAGGAIWFLRSGARRRKIFAGAAILLGGSLAAGVLVALHDYAAMLPYLPSELQGISACAPGGIAGACYVRQGIGLALVGFGGASAVVFGSVAILRSGHEPQAEGRISDVRILTVILILGGLIALFISCYTAVVNMDTL